MAGRAKFMESTQEGVNSRVVALNSEVMADVQEKCRDCSARMIVEGRAKCYGISYTNGIAFVKLNQTSPKDFIEIAACKPEIYTPKPVLTEIPVEGRQRML